MENQQKLAVVEKRLNALIEKAHIVRELSELINSTLNGDYPEVVPGNPEPEADKPNGFFAFTNQKLNEVDQLLSFSINSLENMLGEKEVPEIEGGKGI